MWDDFFAACEHLGKELLSHESVTLSDLEEWKRGKSKIIHIGIPAHVILECVVRSINHGSPGFLLRKHLLTLLEAVFLQKHLLTLLGCLV